MTLLEVKQLTVAIGNKTICQRLNFSIAQGERWGILGPNGCGKTTLLLTLGGFHPPTEGDIFLRQNKLKHLSSKAIAQAIGLLFQEFHPPFAQTVWEYCLAGRYPHLTYWKKENTHDKQIAMDALQHMGLVHCLNKPITQLSGGEKRRLAIAALLTQTPYLYLLDEPTNHLDIHHQIHVLTHFHSLTETKSAAMIMSLHDINLAQQFCSHILLLYPNGCILHGQTRDLLTTTHLSQLYQHPITAISHHEHLYWRAETSIF